MLNASDDTIKITIIYDNTTVKKELLSDWGFSCLVEAYGKKILFDTGAKGEILLSNMKALDILPASIDMVFISHDHWDHIDGLSDFLKIKNVTVFCPASCISNDESIEIVKITEKFKIYDNIYSTGELEEIEHSLVIRQGEELTVVTGCSHPGVDIILNRAAEFGRVKNIIGGFHDFSDLEALGVLEKICPTHCTQYIDKIKGLYPDKYIEGGAGTIISL